MMYLEQSNIFNVDLIKMGSLRMFKKLGKTHNESVLLWSSY